MRIHPTLATLGFRIVAQSRRLALTAVAGCALLAGGCSSSPADAAGDYSIALTDGANACQIANWTVGSQATNIPLTVTQVQGSADITAVVGGVAAVGLGALVGSATFSGEMSGAHMSAGIDGTRVFTMGLCLYTINADVEADLSGDVLQGTVDYAAATNGVSDCAPVAGCHSTQSFNGTRPPSP